MAISAEHRNLSLLHHCRDAFINLMATKLRTFLAVLGILVGAASVVAMLSGGQLVSRQVLLQFKALGTNLLAIEVNDSSQRTGASAASTTKKLSLNVVLNMKKSSEDIQLVAPYTNLYIPILFNGIKLQGNILGATYALHTLMKAELLRGRYISFLDGYSNYCIVGNKLYQSITKAGYRHIIGDQLNLNGNYFTIAGILKKWPQNTFLFADLNNSVIIPIQSSMLLRKYAQISSIITRIRPGSNITRIKNDISHYFRDVAPSKQLYFQSPQQIIQQMKKQQVLLTLFLGFIGLISLIVGGIGVMNIMLVSVTERKREIGIRMAIGAKRRDIQLMFLIEAIMLSIFGGIVGVILGIIISYIIAAVKGWNLTIFWMPPAIGFSISVIVGIFFGFYPAYKASKLDPIETLRSE